MIMLFLAMAMAEPTMCDPKADTANALAGGFCLDEAEYLEIGDLRKRIGALEVEVEAKGEEIESFEAWKARQDKILEYTVTSMTAAHEQGINLVVATAQGDLEACRERGRRKFMERHGFAIGLTAGVVGTVALTAVTLDVYGGIVAE